MKKYYAFLFILLFAFAIACSSGENYSHMKFKITDENGKTQTIQIYGIPTDATQEEMSALANEYEPLQALNRTDEHPWGGEYKALPKPKKKFVKCGEFMQADPSGDCCCKSYSSCYCQVIINDDPAPSLPPMAKTQKTQ